MANKGMKMKKTLILMTMVVAVFTGCTQKIVGVSHHMTYDATGVKIDELEKGKFCESDAQNGERPTVGLAALKGSISTIYFVDHEANSEDGECFIVYGKK